MPPPARSSSAQADRQDASAPLQGETPLMQVRRRWPDDRRGRRGLDRHPRRQDASRRDPHGAAPERDDWRSGSSASRTRWRRSPSAIRTSRANLTDPRKPIGVFLLVGPVRRRQDRDGAGPGRPPLRRRAEPDHRSTCREYQEAHTVSLLKGSPARLRRLRRGRRPDRGRPPPALFASSCSTRSRRPTPTCMELFLPGLRQGNAARTARAARSTSRTP